MRDISETGAELRFRVRPSIPDFFELCIPSRGKIVRSGIAWTGDCEAGISFEQIITPSSSDGELLIRMAALEVANCDQANFAPRRLVLPGLKPKSREEAPCSGSKG